MRLKTATAMELFLQFSTTVLAGILGFAVFLYYLSWKPKRAQIMAQKTAPEVAGAWPLIGHLHLSALGDSQLPHVTLGSMADKYGPIFTVKLGLHTAVVVSNWEMAKECLTTNDRVFASRPKQIAAELMGYNYAAFAAAPYGPYWREMRKIATLELFSQRRLEMLGHIQRSEVKTCVKEIYEQWVQKKKSSGSDKVLVEMKGCFLDMTFSFFVRILAGKRYSCEDEEGILFQKAAREFFKLLGMFNISDAIPFLRCLDLGRHEKDMKRIGKVMDSILESWLKERKEKRNSGTVKSGEACFVDVMLSTVPQDLHGYDADTMTKAMCLVILAAGTDTTSVTLTWALSLLLNNRHVLKKAQEELDIHVGRERQVEESDMKNLAYLQAILKETLRLYPAVPLSGPHESIENCTVNGYNISRGSRLVVNLWKIHRDPRVWSDPCEFKPERFLTTHKEVDFRGQHFELIPFGSGRRMCPGINLSLNTMPLTLASLLHGFEFETASDEPVDMSESFGLTNLKATPLEAIITPRLASHLYV